MKERQMIKIGRDVKQWVIKEIVIRSAVRTGKERRCRVQVFGLVIVT